MHSEPYTSLPYQTAYPSLSPIMGPVRFPKTCGPDVLPIIFQSSSVSFLFQHLYYHSDTYSCLLSKNDNKFNVFFSITVGDFLIVSFHNRLIDHFYNFFNSKYFVKLLVRPTFFLGWTVIYPSDGSNIIIQTSLILTTIVNAVTAAINGRQIPCTYVEDVCPPMEHDTPLPSTNPKIPLASW